MEALYHYKPRRVIAGQLRRLCILSPGNGKAHNEFSGGRARSSLLEGFAR